jgi:hypothetical protein
VTGDGAISGLTCARVFAPYDPRAALAGFADHHPPHCRLEGCVTAEAITMTQRLGERVLDDIAAELLVTNDRARDLLESRSVATVEGLELLERNRTSAVSKRAHGHAMLECSPCITNESGIA